MRNRRGGKIVMSTEAFKELLDMDEQVDIRGIEVDFHFRNTINIYCAGPNFPEVPEGAELPVVPYTTNRQLSLNLE